MLVRIKKAANNFREMVWPLLAPLEEISPRQISEADCNWNNDEIDMMLEYVEKYSTSEEERKKEVESKSTLFIGTFGVATAILINLVKDMLFNNAVPHTPFVLFLISMMTLAIIYLCRAIWFSIKALKRRNYSSLGFPNFMLSDCTDKKQKIIIRYYNNTKKNQDEINIKVDYMTMAQEYFKRAILVVALFSGIVLSEYIMSYEMVMKDILSAIESLSFNQITLIEIFGGIFILLVLVIALFHKINKIERQM